jgi:uncharacterized SAM-binding protein YcdF (DUF218 family)
VTDASAVVIFGAAVRPGGEPSRALRDRVMAAFAWGEAQSPPALYVPTGAVGRHGPAEAEVMAGLLREGGVPAHRIVQEPTGTDTFSSAVACVRLLRARGHRGRVMAASNAYHLPRCVALLWLAGFRDVGAVPPPAGPAASAWRRRWYWRLREVPALPYDALLMVWARLRGRL